MGPTCWLCDRLYPQGADHESCAEARIYSEGGGWLFLGPENAELPSLPPWGIKGPHTPQSADGGADAS